MTTDQTTIEPSTERKPSAIDLKIADLKRNAHFFKAVADGDGDNKSTPEYQAHRRHMAGLTIGAAIGLGELYRSKESAKHSGPGEQLKALRADARWFAAAAASALSIEKSSPEYMSLADSILDGAISAATASGKMKAPTRSFAKNIEEKRDEMAPDKGRSA